MATHAGLEGGRAVRGDRARRDQGAVDHEHQSGRQPAARRRHARRARQAGLSRRFRGQRPCRRPSRRGDGRPAGSGMGREGRHGDQFRTPHFAPAAVSPPARARRGRIGARSARSRGGSATVQPSPIAARPTSFASMRRCRRSRTTARAPSTSARWRRSPTLNTTRSRPRNGRCRAAGQRRKRFFSQGGFFHPDGRARFVAVEDPCRRA